jgi:hypothetical protein
MDMMAAKSNIARATTMAGKKVSSMIVKFNFQFGILKIRCKQFP